MNSLQVGFGRTNIDPPLGIAVYGYFVPRFASRILDSIYANAIALSAAPEKTGDADVWNPDTGRYDAKEAKRDHSRDVLMISIDNLEISTKQCSEFAEYICERTGVPAGSIFLHATHTHNGPYTEPVTWFKADDVIVAKYAEFLKYRLADVAAAALADMKAARMGFCVGNAPDRVAYIRRYRMKDGSSATCPEIGDPNIVEPIGTLDQHVNVIRFDREGADTIVLMNYGLHADCLNLDVISPDWPGWMSRTFETAVPGTKCVFFNGAEGDVGSTHITPEGGDMNDTKISFDSEMKSEGMARFVGRALCGTILQVYDKVEYVDVDEVKCLKKTVKIKANVPEKRDLPLAHKFKELHDAGHDEQIPFTAMELTTVVAEALRMCKLENGPEFFDFVLTGVKIGPIAFAGIPGEPFTEIGRQVKKAEGWRLVCPTCLVNGAEGYFPMKECYDEGGYEARSSFFKGGVAESIIAGELEVLEELRR